MEEIQRHAPEATRRQAPRPIGSGVRTGGDDDTDSGTVQVTWGALIDDLEIAGMTVGDVQTLLQATYNIAPGVQTNVNGEEADADTLLATGDSLEFVRAAGEKGAG
jgi:hypothetical protein